MSLEAHECLEVVYFTKAGRVFHVTLESTISKHIIVHLNMLSNTT